MSDIGNANMLHDIWNEMRRKGACSREFNSYALFRSWALDSGYMEGAKLIQEDLSLPHSRDNCAWELPEADREKMAAQWDRYIDGVRCRLGMEPIMTTSPCTGCQKEKNCAESGGICKTRERYYDAAMARLRKRLGVKGENYG